MTNDEMCEIAVNDVGKRIAQLNMVQYRTIRDFKGIDAYYEIYGDSEANGLLFSGQIKGGPSYIKGDKCYLYDDKKAHIEVWKNFDIPVLLFIRDDKEDKIYWIDVQKYILDNPQKDDIGFTFLFHKEGNLLDNDSREKIIMIAKAKSGKLNKIKDRANYYYNFYLSLAKTYVTDLLIEENNFTDEYCIREWLEKYSFSFSKNLDKVVSCIYYYVNGFGIIGMFMSEAEVKQIIIQREKFWIKRTDNGIDLIENSNYNFNKIIQYFEKYKIDDGIFPICSTGDVEATIYNSSNVNPKQIHIHKKTNVFDIFACNTKGKIDKKANRIIKNIIEERGNTLVVGPINHDVETIITAMTTFFDKSENIAVIEDRKTISVFSGSANYYIAHSTENEVLITTINNAVSSEFDRTIFNIGNFTSNILSKILSIFNQRKGCIAFYANDTICFNNKEDLLLTIQDSEDGFMNKNDALIFTEGIDYIFKLKYCFDRNLFLNEIRKRDKDKWNVIYSFEPIIFEED